MTSIVETAARMQSLQDRGYIAALFSSLITHRALVSLFLPQNAQRYTSTVLLQEPAAGRVLFDQPFPSNDAGNWQVGMEVVMEAHFEGTDLRCCLEWAEPEEHDGLTVYRLKLPTEVAYAQRRSTHRAKVLPLAVPVELYTEQGMACKAVLYDISANGLSLLLEDASAFHNTETYRCTLYPHGMPSFHSKVEVCCLRREATIQRDVLGATFTGLDKRAEHTLNRMVAELERQLVRSRRSPSSSGP